MMNYRPWLTRMQNPKLQPTRHEWSDEDNTFLRANFDYTHRSLEDMARWLSERYGKTITPWQVRYQVEKLGLPRTWRELGKKYWTEKEEERLGELLEQYPVSEVARRLRRSPASVRFQATKMGLSTLSRLGWYTENEVAQILGVDSHRVNSWINRGILPASYHYGTFPTQHGMTAWHIKEEDLVAFLRRYAPELTGRHVDVGQIVDMLSAAPRGEEPLEEDIEKPKAKFYPGSYVEELRKRLRLKRYKVQRLQEKIRKMTPPPRPYKEIEGGQNPRDEETGKITCDICGKVYDGADGWKLARGFYSVYAWCPEHADQAGFDKSYIDLRQQRNPEMPKRGGRLDKMIEDLVGTITDPLIVMPGGWGESLPKWIKDELVLERMKEQYRTIGGGEATATDLEAMAYLFTASLTFPLSRDWAEIYMAVFRKEMRRHGTEVPGDFPDPQLSDYQKGMLNHLKRWIYDKRVQARKAKMRGEKIKSESISDIGRAMNRAERRRREKEASKAPAPPPPQPPLVTPPPSDQPELPGSPPSQPRRHIARSRIPGPYAANRAERRRLQKQQEKELARKEWEAHHYEPPAGTPKRESSQIRKTWLPEGIEMWMVPKDEFIGWQIARYPDTNDSEIFQWQHEHRRAVAIALRDGKPVRPEVMHDYPGLAEHPERGISNPIRRLLWQRY